MLNREREALRLKFLALLKKGIKTPEAMAKLEISGRTARRWAEQSKIDEIKAKVANNLVNSTHGDNPSLIKSNKRFGVPSHRGFKSYKRFIVVGVQNDTEIREDFLESILFFGKMNDAKLLVVPYKYRFSEVTSSFHSLVEPYLFYEDVALGPKINLLSRLAILPTIMNPFAGIDPLSKGSTILIPGPQQRVKTLPTVGKCPAQMISTGTLSCKKGAYPRNKTGIKAEFNHSNAAVLVEIGKGDSFFTRYLNCDDKGGFYDYVYGNEGYYCGQDFTPLKTIAGFQPGDSHFSEADPTVTQSKFFAPDSIMQVLKPERLYLHDSLSFRNQNHHDQGNFVLQWAKHKFGMASVEDEMIQTAGAIEKIVDAAPVPMNVYIVESNHDKAADKWLTNCDPRKDLLNAELYFKMMTLTMAETKKKPNGVSIPGFYELWLRNSKYASKLKNVKFFDGNTPHWLFDILMSLHGDKGANGARGSIAGFSKLPFKCNVGHSHSPGIEHGADQSGTSTWLQLGYTGPIGSWMHTDNIVWNNGKRGQVTTINGKWRLTP